MTEETLKCPLCDTELYNAGDDGEGDLFYMCNNNDCFFDCIPDEVFHIKSVKKLQQVINEMKQKSYSEGYYRGMAEWVELTTRQTTEKIEQQIKHDLETLDQTIKLKQSWIDEGRRQALSELNELECPCCFVSLIDITEVIEDGEKYKVHGRCLEDGLSIRAIKKESLKELEK